MRRKILQGPRTVGGKGDDASALLKHLVLIRIDDQGAVLAHEPYHHRSVKSPPHLTHEIPDAFVVCRTFMIAGSMFKGHPYRTGSFTQSSRLKACNKNAEKKVRNTLKFSGLFTKRHPEMFPGYKLSQRSERELTQALLRLSASRFAFTPSYFLISVLGAVKSACSCS